MLAVGQSLASYGIGAERDSAVLELVPVPLVGSSSGSGHRASSAGKAGSPPLSSPEHGLFANWQAAQAGLASGLMPQLAPSGSSGSYFLRGADGEPGNFSLCYFVKESACIDRQISACMWMWMVLTSYHVCSLQATRSRCSSPRTRSRSASTIRAAWAARPMAMACARCGYNFWLLPAHLQL